MSTHAPAPDLAVAPPRPMDATLDGYVWLPRMIDKARASAAGTLGDYVYPCPIDRECQRRLGLDADAFRELAARLGDDEAILAALRAQGIPSAEEARFDPVRMEDELHAG